MKELLTMGLLLLMISSATVSCQSNENKDDFNLTVSELKEKMKTDKSLVILDCRTPQELTSELGQIDGVINIPVQVLDQEINKLEKYKNNNIAVICRSGNRSVFATKMLQAKGYKAKNVLGGMIAYRK
ncbi:MAG: rhodanese-like domain-containing protein [Ignavibacteriae bacterium]|nr:rhodanese-like domain-containing protein [Ignavibacteriota bacterium]